MLSRSSRLIASVPLRHQSHKKLHDHDEIKRKKEEFKKKSDWYLTERAKAVEAASGQKSIKLTFTDHKYAFRSKKTYELMRAGLCFKLFSYEKLVEHNMEIMAQMEKILGKRIYNQIMKM